MLLVRSWPEHVPPAHPRIIDAVTRVILPRAFDYAPLAGLDDDVLHLDWDVAVSPEDLHTFAVAARRKAAQPLVGPCRVYPGSLHGTVARQMAGARWNVRSSNGAGAMADCQPGDPSADLWGFAMVYLPREALSGFVHSNPGRDMSDIGFAG